jgi:tetrahydromethanopterin S-methyltransferase subunit H
MVTFTKEQKVYKIGNVEIGGQPGERPTVLIGSIFFGKHQIVSDPCKGIFDHDKAKAQLQSEKQCSDFSSNPRFIDPIGETTEALIRYVQFLSEQTDAPLLIDSPYQQVRMETLRYFKGSSLTPRLIYNSIAEDFTEEELLCIRECGIKSAVILAFSKSALLPKDRLTLLRETLLPAAERAGIEHILIDTGVLDVPSISWAARTIYEVKREFGFPAGCAPANALFTWEKIKKQGTEAFHSAAVALFAMTRLQGADFILYGPLRLAPWVYPACAVIDAMMAYAGRFSGIKAATKNHPLYTIFKN